MKMAEGTGLEPVTLAGSQLSKPLPRPVGRLPKMVREVGFEPTKSLRSERSAFTSLTTRAIGGESRSRTCDVYLMGRRFTAGCLRLWAYLSDKWCARQDSNLHYLTPQVSDSASWPTSAKMVGASGVEPPLNAILSRVLLPVERRADGGPDRSRTDPARGLSALPLPRGLQVRKLWRREGGSNSQEMFHSAVFGTAGLAVYDRSLRKIKVSDCDTAAANWNLAMRAIGTSALIVALSGCASNFKIARVRAMPHGWAKAD